MIEKWIVSVQDGRTEDYAAIVKLYQRRIFIYCCRMLENEQEAEDAAQDVFVKAYQSIQSYRPTAGFSAWLYKIAYRHCLNALRRRRLQLHKHALFQPNKSVESPEEIVDRQLFSPPLDSVLKRLSIVEHNLLVLSVFEERTSVEIAAIIGKSPESVKKRIARTKQKVRDMLEKEGEKEWIVQRTLLKTKL
ncbi:RNA polymerase sigma factor [Paenibacillus sp. YAF4_2]|uniref:RNA polymerase sigma factor n=1 Tax=Paenibacillus sp. YAF4_2 TaxID=3233085 RepID=UPI003F9D9D06